MNAGIIGYGKRKIFLIAAFCLLPALAAHAEEKAEVVWQREASLGYDRTSGNTETGQLSARLFINRNRKHVDEITAKADFYYSSSERKMNAQKWYGMGRYAFSFWTDKRWYNFYKLEADHDRFANIDYRLIPAGGVGYWFCDTEDMKLMAEAAAGLEHTNYRDATKDSNEGILIPRAFFEKSVFEKAKITQDAYLYPQFEDFGNYRVRSETALTVSLNEKLALRLSVIDDYNSTPPAGTKKNDFTFMSSLVYSFGN